jgi:hypothetical protein
MRRFYSAGSRASSAGLIVNSCLHRKCKLLGLELTRCSDLDFGLGLVTGSGLAVLDFPEKGNH